MTGNEYKKLIGRYIVSAYGARGLKVYDEVSLGTSIIGKQRRIDLFVVGPENVALAVECKYQDGSGTADEKIPYALNDMAAQRVPGIIVYAGMGFSEGVRHLLQGSEQAAYCLPDESNLHPAPRRGGAMNSGTWQLDHVVAQTFKLWDIILGAKQPIVLDPAPKQLTPLDENAAAPDSETEHGPMARRGAAVAVVVRAAAPKPAMPRARRKAKKSPQENTGAQSSANETAAPPASGTPGVEPSTPPAAPVTVTSASELASLAALPEAPAPTQEVALRAPKPRDLAAEEPLLHILKVAARQPTLPGALSATDVAAPSNPGPGEDKAPQGARSSKS